MESNLNVSINLPQSELEILKKMARALGWNLFVEQDREFTDESKRMELVKKLYGCIQLPVDFDYKNELGKALTEKYNQ